MFGRPRVVCLNAGAIVVADILLEGHEPKEAIGEVLRFVQYLADDGFLAKVPELVFAQTDLMDQKPAA